jgi:formylmethanofuran dehydrogenase subunit E
MAWTKEERREKPRFECILCDSPIYKDDIYYELDGEIFCRHCIEKARRTA